MWSKITSVLKPKQNQDVTLSQSQQVEVTGKALEQHPNLSVFVPPNDVGSTSSSSPPPSPSKSSSKRNVLKRISKMPMKEDPENAKSTGSLRLSKKSRPDLNFKTVGSNSPLAQAAAALNESSSSDLSRRASFNVLSSNHESSKPTRASIDVLRRPSLDILRNEGRSATPQPYDEPATPAVDKMGSVRSILRDPKTPGTGQNVRFFSRDAYKVISPEVSMDTEERFFTPNPPPKDEQASFLDRLNQASPDESSSTALKQSKSGSKPPRPSISDLFSPMNGTATLPDVSSLDGQSMSLDSTSPQEPFAVSEALPVFHPPGLDFDVDSFDRSLDLDGSFDDDTQTVGKQLTSTPFRAKAVPKVKDLSSDSIDQRSGHENSGDFLEVSAPRKSVDDSIFHGADIEPRLPTPLHERSRSFTLGAQTDYFSGVSNSRATSSKTPTVFTPSNLKGSSLSSAAPTSLTCKQPRTRAISDTMLQNMLRSTQAPPEIDINDTSSDHIQVYSAAPVPEPDPFSANASTYYTPQVMIPVTPPSKSHIRKTSKEENLIYSLQTQLSLQNDLCQQYEIDLRARDEIVNTLSQKINEVEKEDAKRRATLRGWKKKVQELERACRQLEEEVDSSRQMSFERSVMDEASGEALRMLHRQIAALEKDKAEQVKREKMLQDEVAALEAMVKDKSEDVVQLKEMLWNRDVSERELEAGLRDAREQMEQLSNVSVAIDEEEMRRLMSENKQASEDQTRHRIAETVWQQEKEELLMKLEGLQVEKKALEEKVEKVKVSQQQHNDSEELNILKNELEAQWANTEKMSEQLDVLEKEKVAAEVEREQLKKTVEELEARMASMDAEWHEAEIKKEDLEGQLQDVWQTHDALEKEREQLEYDLHQAEERIKDLESDIQGRDSRIHQLTDESQFHEAQASRAQELGRKRDEEINDQTDRIVKMQDESEHLREQLSTMTREYNRLLDEQSRADRSMSSQEAELRTSMEQIIKQKAELDVALKDSKNQVATLQEEAERLRRQVLNLKQISADADVEIGRLKKQQGADKDDILGLNMALDAKQQELDLMKRNLGVRGTAGATPAKPISSGSTKARRDSSVFTATPLVRPPSAASDISESISAGKRHERKGSSAERPGSSASVTRPSSTALGRSSRVNTTATAGRTSTVPMGPPTAKPRSSVSSTPTPAQGSTSAGSKPLGRSSSMSPTGTPLPQRRVANVVASYNQQSAAAKSSASKAGRITSPVSSVPESDEKENLSAEDMATPTVRRRVAVPAP